MLRLIFRLVSMTAMLLVASAYTFAGNPDRFQTNRDIHVETNDNPNDVTCFRCSIYIRGEVRGDVTAIAGNVVLENGAQVHGDTTSIMGDIHLGADTNVDRDVTAVGGAVRRDSQATVKGDVTALEGQSWLLLIFVVPLVLLGGMLALIVWLVLWLVRRTNQRVPVTA
jgi:hypothetical protein